MRATYRTLRVLATIACRPGVSNREVADGAGITDEGQVSRLLASPAAPRPDRERRGPRQGYAQRLAAHHGGPRGRARAARASREWACASSKPAGTSQGRPGVATGRRAPARPGCSTNVRHFVRNIVRVARVRGKLCTCFALRQPLAAQLPGCCSPSFVCALVLACGGQAIGATGQVSGSSQTGQPGATGSMPVGLGDA